MDFALTFAHLARDAFVAVYLLRSLERKLIDEGASCFYIECGIDSGMMMYSALLAWEIDQNFRGESALITVIAALC